ncbi:MAG: helix-turn-helix domain-containing protein [Lachnospiraceae bacterium]
MKKQTLGTMIATLRKENGMTQLELAEKMGVTDKAVSKWERDLSCPDVSSIPKRAEIFSISVDELMQVKEEGKEEAGQSKISEIVNTVAKSVGFAMGVAVVVLSAMGSLDANTGITMLGVGLTCFGITMIGERK